MSLSSGVWVVNYRGILVYGELLNEMRKWCVIEVVVSCFMDKWDQTYSFFSSLYFLVNDKSHGLMRFVTIVIPSFLKSLKFKSYVKKPIKLTHPLNQFRVWNRFYVLTDIKKFRH